MREIDAIFQALAKSAFRQGFHLGHQEHAYLQAKGLTTVLQHARDFIDKRLAAGSPVNDGRQTPFRGHPVFIAQHATATCCRGCLEKWHAIPRGHALDDKEKDHVIAVLERWLQAEAPEAASNEGV
jgi:predicted Fe-S protein YdhL (DUF1289 family)